MTDATAKRISDCDAETYAERSAEAAFILLAQTEIQKILNRKGLRYRDLAKRLGVTEARISQMFGETATNLTIKTVARIFHHLGETAYLSTAEEVERRLGAARGVRAEDDEQRWTAAGLPAGTFQVSLDVALEDAPPSFDVPQSHRSVERWVKAEAAVRRAAA